MLKEELEKYNSFIIDGEKIVNIIFNGNNNYSFNNSPIKVMISLDITDDTYSNNNEIDYISMDYLPRFKNIETLLVSDDLLPIYKKYNAFSNSEKSILLTFIISLFILNQMYICFKNTNKNTELLDMLYNFFDETDVSGHKKRTLNNKSSVKDRENYLKIKFVFLFESLTLFLSKNFNIHIPNNTHKNFLIKSKYFKISTYYDENIKNIPFEFNDFQMSLFNIKSNLYTASLYSFYYLISHDKDYNICNNCHKIFKRYSNRLSTICNNCANDSDYDIDNDRKNREHNSNRKKIKYIETHYKSIQNYLDNEILKDIGIILKDKHTSIRHGNNLQKIYKIVYLKYDEVFPSQKTERKGNIIY